MKKEPSSLEIYNRKKREYDIGRAKPKIKDVELLLEAMKSELIIESNSPLLDIAYNECVNFCAEQGIAMINYEGNNIVFLKQNKRREIPTFAAWKIPIFLSDYMSDDFSPRIVEESLRYFWGDYVPKYLDYRLLIQALKTIDIKVVEQRRKMYYTSIRYNENINCEKNEDIVITELVRKEIGDKIKQFIEEAEENKKAIIDQAHIKAKSDAGKIIDSAHRTIEREKQSKLAAAQQQADEIINKASLTAGIKLDKAKKRVLMLSENKRLVEYNTAQQNTEQRFAEVREALVKANESIKLLEDSVTEGVTRKAYMQLIELYNLIADTKDSTYTLALQTKSQDLENASYNMDVFLDMLVEYLADYGVQIIASFQGDHFSAKHHMLGKRGIQYDPRNARITRSIRNGFIWGEQVIQKELVEIEGDKHVSWN